MRWVLLLLTLLASIAIGAAIVSAQTSSDSENHTILTYLYPSVEPRLWMLGVNGTSCTVRAFNVSLPNIEVYISCPPNATFFFPFEITVKFDNITSSTPLVPILYLRNVGNALVWMAAGLSPLACAGQGYTPSCYYGGVGIHVGSDSIVYITCRHTSLGTVCNTWLKILALGYTYQYPTGINILTISGVNATSLTLYLWVAVVGLESQVNIHNGVPTAYISPETVSSSATFNFDLEILANFSNWLTIDPLIVGYVNANSTELNRPFVTTTTTLTETTTVIETQNPAQKFAETASTSVTVGLFLTIFAVLFSLLLKVASAVGPSPSPSE